jgi:S1 RNA binding domain protein
MQPEVGAILEGKITGITKFGAFVTMPDGVSGLVHISEIANTYVTDINDHLKQGQTVRVKVLAVGEGNKINLSIKKAEEPAPVRPRQETSPSVGQTPRPARAQTTGKNSSFEDKLKQFMQESDSRMSGNKLYSDRRVSNRRRRG